MTSPSTLDDSLSAATLAVVAADVVPLLPIAGGLDCNPVPDGTPLPSLVGTVVPPSGWKAASAGCGGLTLTVALPDPLADALGAEDGFPAGAGRLLATLAAGLGLPDPGPVEEAAPAAALAGGGAACLLEADGMTFGLLAVRTDAQVPGARRTPIAPRRPAAAADAAETPVPAAMPANFGTSFSATTPPVVSADPLPTGRLDLLHAVELQVTAELGRAVMTVRDLLSLRPGAVLELDRAAGSPVDLLVNGTLVARGEVVVVDEEYGVRVTEIVGPGGER